MSPRQSTQREAATTSKPRNVARKNAAKKKEDGSLGAATLSKPLDNKEDDTLSSAASLSELLDKKEDSLAAAKMVPLDKIVMPSSQPRRYFDPRAMRALFESVKCDGILMPLLVRPVGDKYELVAGKRRYRVAKDVGLTEVPATVREMSDTQAIQYALTENLQREDLNPVEETEGILDLLALRLSTDRSRVISLLNLRAKVKRGLADNDVRPEERLLVEEVFKSIGTMSQYGV